MNIDSIIDYCNNIEDEKTKLLAFLCLKAIVDSAKKECFGLGKKEGMHLYYLGYNGLSELGVDVSSLDKPYD
jgi:hypothetical protein